MAMLTTSNPPSLTLAQLIAWAEQQEPDAIVGYGSSSAHCPLAAATRELLPEIDDVVVNDNMIRIWLETHDQDIEPSCCVVLDFEPLAVYGVLDFDYRFRGIPASALLRVLRATRTI